MDTKTKKILTKLGKEKVELATIQQIVLLIQQIDKDLREEENLYKNFEKSYDVIRKLTSEKINLESKIENETKPFKNVIPKIKNNLTQFKNALNRTEQDAIAVIKKMEDLGIENNEIDLRKIEKIKIRIKNMDFAFLRELPF